MEQTQVGYVRVRVEGSGPNWVCLCQTKQAIKDNLQVGYVCVESAGSLRSGCLKGAIIGFGY
eukprot:363965-Chlamydomonas_euryale.AAC.25